ncbi:hypothetical protein V6N11_056908 [Hibiscus sabdariffa]|uniref:Uncharacterized protein n=1 Tax=Hibiscus sabdariffa TaxID=183260 RepID=A0ABR2T571_9ROSI
MVETKRSRDQSSVMNEFIIEENLESDDSEYMPYEHENSESDFLDSENDHCDATDKICDGPVHGSVEKSLGFVPHNTSVVSSDSDDDVDSLHSHNVRTCRGHVRSNIRHNTPLVATPIASAPLTPPGSPHLSPPATAPPFPAPPTTAPLAPAPSVSAPSIIDRATKLPFQRSTKVHLKRTAGRQISPQQPTQQQPTPYQVVRWMMQQTTNSENVLRTSQESIGSFKPKTN